MIKDFTDKLIENGYSEAKAKEIVSDLLDFIEKHSVSCLEDGFHYFMEIMTKNKYESKY